MRSDDISGGGGGGGLPYWVARDVPFFQNIIFQ